MIKSLLALALIGLGLAAAVLTIGAFGSQNPNNPVVFISDLELSLARSINFLEQNQYAFARGFAYMGICVIFASLATLLVASAKSQAVPSWRGRRMRKGI